MRAIIILGWKEQGGAPEGLYCGLDGVKAGKAAEVAQASGEYVRIGRITNPSYTPLPCFPVAKAKATPKVPPAPPSKPKDQVAPQTPAPVAQPQAGQQAASATETNNESESNV